MELGIYHEFPVLPGRSQAECFAAGFDIVDASEEFGLDVMWLAELHFDKRRALAASPIVLGTAIAARTQRIRIGTSVQVLPLANPLRIAEEAAILDHVSKGRLIFGIGRSGVVKTYEALNIAYSESKDREIECLEIIQRAWQEDNFSYKGKFYDIKDVTVVPQRTAAFGYGQAVMSDGSGVHFGASEPRHDGAAIPEAPPVFKLPTRKSKKQRRS